jgi:diadenosine tetraphosphate (Ap4A) HIT family hydrolase
MKLFNDDTILVTENFHVGQDWETPIVGFFIVGAKDKSKKSIEDFSDAELTEFITVMKKVRVAMREVFGIQEVRLIQNEGSKHGFHMWLFPRYEWMNEFGTKLESLRPIINYAVENLNTQEKIDEVNEAIRMMRGHLNK